MLSRSKGYTNEASMEMKTTIFPIYGIGLAVGLILLSPFMNGVTAYAAFILGIYRIIRYDIEIFCTDYCILACVSLPFETTGGVSLLSYLCIIALIWYLIRGYLEANASFVLLLLLMDYLLLRTQGEINNFVLCFSQLFLLLILLPNTDEITAIRTSKAFCFSMIISSCYAFLFRNTSQITNLRGEEVPAYWQSTSMRFQGLFRDPNYYMALIVIAIILIIKLRTGKKIGRIAFTIGIVSLIYFGLMTYSKTFMLVSSGVLVIYLIILFVKRKYLQVLMLSIITICIILLSLQFDGSPISIIIHRLTDGSGLDDLTTGRSEIYVRYLSAINENLSTFIFGNGMSAEILGMNTHNLFIELAYYIGTAGLVIYLIYIINLAYMTANVWSLNTNPRKPYFYKYLTLIVAFIMFCTLHGMYSTTTYVIFFLAAVSTKLPFTIEVSEDV